MFGCDVSIIVILQWIKLECKFSLKAVHTQRVICQAIDRNLLKELLRASTSFYLTYLILTKSGLIALELQWFLNQSVHSNNVGQCILFDCWKKLIRWISTLMKKYNKKRLYLGTEDNVVDNPLAKTMFWKLFII